MPEVWINRVYLALAVVASMIVGLSGCRTGGHRSDADPVPSAFLPVPIDPSGFRYEASRFDHAALARGDSANSIGRLSRPASSTSLEAQSFLSYDGSANRLSNSFTALAPDSKTPSWISYQSSYLQTSTPSFERSAPVSYVHASRTLVNRPVGAR